MTALADASTRHHSFESKPGEGRVTAVRSRSLGEERTERTSATAMGFDRVVGLCLGESPNAAADCHHYLDDAGPHRIADFEYAHLRGDLHASLSEAAAEVCWGVHHPWTSSLERRVTNADFMSEWSAAALSCCLKRRFPLASFG
jgi:hypothetical protein